jgi:hypothetical protein
MGQYDLPRSEKRSYTEVALEEARAKARKDREEAAYRANYKGPIATQGESHSPLGDKLTQALEWLGLSSSGAYDFGQKIDKAASTLTPYGPMKQVNEGDFAGAAESLVGGPEMAMAMGPAKQFGRDALAEAKSGIKAYHGSPHSFDQFDISKIGTGEGAQAYGHGLYFAENEGVAKSYRDALSGPKLQFADSVEPEVRAAVEDMYAEAHKAGSTHDFLKAHNRDWNALNEGVDDKIKRGIADGSISLPPDGHMYEVNINADPEHFLDYDKPLSEQPHVLPALNEAGYGVPKSADLSYLEKMAAENGPDSWYALQLNAMKPQLGKAGGEFAPKDAATTEALKQAGIPGIKYLDAGSRAAAEGSRNYVVFDPKIIDIVKKYGIAAAVGAGLVSPMMAEQMRRQGVVEEQS